MKKNSVPWIRLGTCTIASPKVERHPGRIVRGKELRRDPEPGNTKEQPDFEDDYPDQAKDDAEENVAPKQRIADLPANQASPRDDGLRPKLADERLLRNIENPRNAGHEQRRGPTQVEKIRSARYSQ
ncbi:MAG TPA: hypothetical protein VMU26_09880 [Candidatus Polarisedimenticolia bacterium]|nr:hypothetical protein [Candidatus Polarisedimenticolia bacterium]